MSGQSSSHTKGVKTLENLYTINLYFYGQTLQVGLCGKRIKKKSLVAVFVAVDCLVGSFDLYFIEKSVDVCICRLRLRERAKNQLAIDHPAPFCHYN